MDEDLIDFEQKIREAQEGEKIKKDIVIMADEDDNTEEQKQDVEEERFETPDQVPKAEEKQDDKYSDIIEDEPEIRNYLEYKRINRKLLLKEPLTIDEQVFKDDWENQLKKEKKMQDETEKIAKEEMERQKKYQDEIRAEYLETKAKNPEKIVRVSEKEISLTGGESIPKLLGFVFTMKTARKKGGKVLVQVFRNRKVLIKWTLNDVTFVEFYTKDEKGNELMEVTRFSEYPYSFEGSPIPVLFAIQGYAEGFDFFSEFRKDLSSEMVSRLVTRAFHAGYLKGAEVSQPKNKNNFLEGLLPFVPLILLLGMIAMLYLLNGMYGDITAMSKTIAIMQSQLNTLAPTIDANTLVLR